MVALFRLLARLPLWLLHALGAGMGWAVYLLSASYRRRWRENCVQAGMAPQQVRGAIAHAGRMMFELPRIWLGRPVPYEWQGIEHVQRAFASGKGVMMLTPHIGCFEMVAQAVADRFGVAHGGFTALYRPARQRWLAEMMTYVRTRPGMCSAPTTLAGVRQLMRELRAGHAVGLLPDHVPPEGQGVWAPFFGKPAYTMTLAAKLLQQTGAQALVMWGERLRGARGYRIHARPLTQDLPAELNAAVAHINREMELVILSRPQQYMWSYARYRAPRPQSSHD